MKFLNVQIQSVVLIKILIFLLSHNFIIAQNTIPIAFNNKIKVGSIKFNSELDNKEFYLCDELNIMEYYQVNPIYGEGNKHVRMYFQPFMTELNSLCEKDGYILIRFIINCEGQTDRFRSNFYLENLHLSESNIQLQRKLIFLVNKMKNWKPGEYQGIHYDSYKNICFKIMNREIVEIIS